MNMKKVRKVLKHKAFVGNNDEILREFKVGLQEYDDRGNLTKEVQYDNNGQVDVANGYKYDDKNRLIEEIHYYEEEVGEMISYQLDSEGRIVRSETRYADGSVSVKDYSRTENMITIQAVDEDGDIESEDLLKLDEKGNILEEVHLDEDHKVESKFINTYNQKDQLISRVEFGENDEFIRKVLIEYDDKGNAVAETHLNRKDEVMDHITFSFDDHGNRTEWQNSTYLHRTIFDEENRPVREERLNRRSSLVENFTEYKYDEEGRIESEKTFSMGEEYELEPGAVTRTKSDFIIHRYTYEFFDA